MAKSKQKRTPSVAKKPKKEKVLQRSEAPKVSYVDVVDACYCEVTREATEPQWDRDDTLEQHDIMGIALREEAYGDLCVPFEVEKGQTYFLVYVNYDTGDSFGHDAGRVQWIDLYQTREAAEDNAQRCRKAVGFNVKLKLEDGREYEQYASWHGYFEHLNDVIVEPVEIVSRRWQR